MSGSKSIENTICVDSFNRDSTIWPDSSDFSIDLGKKVDAYQVVLTSLELPMTAYLIEPEWSQFTYDLGLSTPFDLAGEVYRTQSFRIGPASPVQSFVLLPPPFAAATVDPAPNNNRVTLTILQHGLTAPSVGLMNVFVQSQIGVAPVAVVGVVGVAGQTLLMDDFLPAGQAVVVFFSGGGPRTFSGPGQLVDVLNANTLAHGLALNARWDPRTTTTTLQLLPRGPLEQTYIVDGSSMLFVFMGVASVSGEINATLFPFQTPSFPGPVVPLNVSPADPPPLATNFLYPSPRYTCHLTPGQYDISAFKLQLETTLNPQILTGNIPQGNFTIAYGNLAPTLMTIGVPGSDPPFLATPTMHPQGLANALKPIIGATALAGLVDIDYSVEEDAFFFHSTGANPLPFVLVWSTSTPQDSLIATTLGFDPALGLLASTRQKGSPRKFFYNMPMSVTLPFAVNGDNVNTVKKLFFSAKQRMAPSLSVAVTKVLGTTLTAPIGGAAVGIVIATTNGKFAYVSHVTADGSQLVITPIIPAIGGFLLAESFFPVPYVTVGYNMYFREVPSTRWNRLAEIIGFSSGVFSLNPENYIIPPFSFNLEHAGYVLVDIENLQHFSATFLHRTGADVKNTLLGKVVLWQPYRYERTSGITRYGTGVSSMREIRIRLLTPWHTLYPLHGRNWSCTLVFGSTQKAVHTECG